MATQNEYDTETTLTLSAALDNASGCKIGGGDHRKRSAINVARLQSDSSNTKKSKATNEEFLQLFCLKAGFISDAEKSSWKDLEESVICTKI